MKNIFLYILCFIFSSIPYDFLAEEISDDENEKLYHYYENMRIGISWYERGDFAKSVYYLNQALKYQKSNVKIKEYLYLSYMNLGRVAEAESIFPYLSIDIRKKYNLSPKTLLSISVDGGLLANSVPSFNTPDETLYSEFVSLNNGGTMSVKSDINLNSYFLLSNQFSFTNTPGYQNVDSSLVNIGNNKTSYNEYDYSISAEIPLSDGWKITTSFALLYVREKTYSVTLDSVENNELEKYNNNFQNKVAYPYSYGGVDYNYYGMNNYWWYNNYNGWYFINNSTHDSDYSYWYLTEEKEKKCFNYALLASISKEYKHFLYDVSFSYLNFYTNKSWQTSFGVDWLPFGNINLHSSTRLCYINRTSCSNNLIFEEILGYKLHKYLFVELGGCFGNMQYSRDNSLSFIYTSQHQTRYQILSNIIFPISKSFSVYLLYRFVKRNATIYYVDEELELKQDNSAFYSNTIIGGLKWRF